MRDCAPPTGQLPVDPTLDGVTPCPQCGTALASGQQCSPLDPLHRLGMRLTTVFASADWDNRGQEGDEDADGYRVRQGWMM